MVVKKLAKESQLPSVLEDNVAEMEGELLGESEQLGGIGSRPPSRPRKLYSRGSVDSQTVTRLDTASHISQSRLSGEELTDKGGESGEGQQCEDSSEDTEGGPMRAAEDQDYDMDLEMEDEKVPYDPTGETCYRAACKIFGVVPVSFCLGNMHTSEMNMMHHGLGPQGTKALAVPLVTNTSILKLNLRDNRMESLGGAAMAEMLKENCYITEMDLSDNRLGLYGAQAISSMLMENSTLVSINLSGNDFDDHAATYLAEALTANQKVEALDLSYNRMGNVAGELLGNAISENTAVKDLNLSWNCIRGNGAVSLATGLGANIFLRKVDLSYNGLGKEGAVAMGEALKMARNPMQIAGCYGILKAIQENPESAVEFLDFSDIPVNQEFTDLHKEVKRCPTCG
ncbi:hypothetical protein SKAU_G00009360 [Synaphobranchus kaupii]|uniref:Leucine-rich repeat-containing protein 74B n=1 Tax=Synaphobranchus kaupii TaxID=118154 RepID=A0A9Q1JC08_SYNKA|nr:hypothetical protein SKAU_G00009360 [Synaphobranchus kaupii]